MYGSITNRARSGSTRCSGIWRPCVKQDRRLSGIVALLGTGVSFGVSPFFITWLTPGRRDGLAAVDGKPGDGHLPPGDRDHADRLRPGSNGGPALGLLPGAERLVAARRAGNPHLHLCPGNASPQGRIASEPFADLRGSRWQHSPSRASHPDRDSGLGPGAQETIVYQIESVRQIAPCLQHSQQE